MEITYNGVKITSNTPPYQELPLDQTINKPIVTISTNPAQYSSIIMYDPDSVKGIFIHWLVINIPKNSTNISDGKPIKDYYKPSPPPKTGKHRYIFELYSHSSPLQIDIVKEINYSDVSKMLSGNPNAKLEKRIAFVTQNAFQGGGRKYINRRRSVRRKVCNKKTRRVYKRGK
jgi:phosphatidylethanolamine-binding protein (PEBP) family uncharacterized protein